MASFLPKNTQDSSPFGWIGWTSLQSMGLSRVFSKFNLEFKTTSPQFKSINSSVLSFLHSPTLTSIHDYWKNHRSPNSAPSPLEWKVPKISDYLSQTSICYFVVSFTQMQFRYWRDWSKVYMKICGRLPCDFPTRFIATLTALTSFLCLSRPISLQLPA